MSLDITGHATKYLEDSSFDNYGYVTIDNFGSSGQPVGGTISLHDVAIQNRFGGNIYFESGVRLENDSNATNNSSIFNDDASHVQKLFGTADVVIEADFSNDGIFKVHQGAVVFGQTYTAQQTGTIAHTILHNGSSITASTYNLWAGYLEGHGTISGNLNVDTATVKPGSDKYLWISFQAYCSVLTLR